MAVKTTQEQLEEVQAAITDITTSHQEYSDADMRVRRASLAQLHAREEVLLTRFRRENRGSAITRVNMSNGT